MPKLSLKEAVELIEKRDYKFRFDGRTREAVEVILNAARSLLTAPEGFPEKVECVVHEDKPRKPGCDYCVNRDCINSMREACLQFHHAEMKRKVEGVDKTIDTVLDEYGLLNAMREDSRNTIQQALSDAIRKEMSR